MFQDIINRADALIRGIGALIKLLSANPSYYPWQVIPPDGKSFDYIGVIETPASGGGVGPDPGIETIVVQFTCPLGYSGIIKRISCNFLGASFNPGLPSLTWRIRNGVSITSGKFVDNYSNINVELGTTQFAREIDGIFVSSGQTYLFTVTNNDPGLPAGPSSQVCCAFGGFFWPSQRSANKQ